MQIADIMSRPVFRVAPSVEAEEAWQLMRKARVRHLVVVDGRTVVGVVTDVHSPSEFRVAVVRNLDPWYAAFEPKPEDKLFLAPDKRVKIW